PPRTRARYRLPLRLAGSPDRRIAGSPEDPPGSAGRTLAGGGIDRHDRCVSPGRASGPPALIRPMLAVTGEPPTGSGWGLEFKWDGVRAVAYVEAGGVRVLSRNDL